MKRLAVLAAIGAVGSALAAPKMPSDDDVGIMFSSSDAFVRVCQLAGAHAHESRDHEALAFGCLSYAYGVANAKAISSRYEIMGRQVCTQDARALDVMNAAFELYEGGEFQGVSPAALIIAAQAKLAPCE